MLYIVLISSVLMVLSKQGFHLFARLMLMLRLHSC